MTKPHSASAGTYLVLTLAPLFWSGNTIVSKLAVGHVDPLTWTLARWILAFLLVLPFAWPHLRADWAKLRPRLLLLLTLGAVGMGLFNLLLYTAPHFTSAVNMSIEQAAIPVLVMLGNFMVFRVRAKLLQVAGVALTIWGVVLVATHGEPGRILSLSVNQGDVLVLSACALYAIYSLALRYRPEIHWLSFLAVTFAGAMLASIAAELVFVAPGQIAGSFAAVTAEGWLYVGYTVIFASHVAQLCYAVSVKRVGPNRASLFINLIPVFGTILSVLILGERFETYHLIASAFVIVGIWLAEWSARSALPEISGAG